jgi:hypothetical protein
MDLLMTQLALLGQQDGAKLIEFSSPLHLSKASRSHPEKPGTLRIKMSILRELKIEDRDVPVGNAPRSDGTAGP